MEMAERERHRVTMTENKDGEIIGDLSLWF